MRKVVIATAIALCVVSLPGLASADTLYLRDGTSAEGAVVSMSSRTITFRLTSGVSRRYATSEIDSIRFYSTDRGNAGGMNDLSFEAPAGTALVVRTVETIDSQYASVDQTFAALVERDVTDASGRVIIPERSSAQLIVRQLASGGRTGSPEVVLDIQSITVGGRRYQVSTTDLSRDNDRGLGKNKRTAEMTGGGAAIGGIIGAIAGGGKGAAIGVLIGGAGGAGAQVLTRGHDVRVPAETVLTFNLDQAITLRSAR